MSSSAFFLRPRVNAGLSYTPPLPLHLGHLRHVRISPSRPRAIAIHAPNVNSLSLNVGKLTDSSREFSTTPRPSAPNSRQPPRNRKSKDESQIQRRWTYQEPSEPRNISRFNVNKSRGTNKYGVPMIYTGPEDDPNRQLKIIDQSVLELENQIRGATLFNGAEEFSAWMSDFKAIYADATGPDRVDIPSRCLTLHDADYGLFESLTVGGQHSFRLAWEELTKEAKAVHWARLSLYLLYNAPDSAWQFLYVTCQDKDRPPFKMAWDCLDLLYHWVLHSREEICGITYDTMIRTVLDPQFWPVIYAPQRAMRLYIKTATHGDVQRAFDIVQKNQNNLKVETWFCFMYRFTHHGDIEGALSALRIIQLGGYDVEQATLQHHCCKLLMRDWVCDEADGRNFYILPRILELGVQPSRDLMNVVLSKAFKTGDSQLGHDIFAYMKEQGHEFDSFTYLSVLQDAVDRGDKIRVEELSEEIRLRPDLSRNPWIVTKLMHARYLADVKAIYPDVPSSTVFFSLLGLYNQLYDLTPLKELGILSMKYTPEEPGENNSPPTIALYLLISTYIRSQKKLAPVIRLYSRWRSLAWQGHPYIAPMQATEHIYNEFLASFRHRRNGIRAALRLVEDMLEGRPGSTIVDGKVITPAKPSTWTWNILLSIFVYHGQPNAKEKVRALMNKHNIKFDAITWNTIISGQVHDPEMSALAQTIKEMEENGVAFDAHTMKALSFVRDPEKLWAAVKDLDSRQSPKPALDQVKPDLQSSPAVETGATRDGAEEDEDDGLLMKGLQRLAKPGRQNLTYTQ